MNPVLLEIPDHFESRRLLIRVPQAGDGGVVNAAIQESFESIALFLPWARERPTVEETEAVMRRGRARFIERSDLPLLLFHRESGEFVGGSGLHRMDWDVPRFEIGYWCRTKFEGQGFIAEAVRRITVFAFEVLRAKRVEIKCETENVRSRRVAESNGFTLEGTLRCDGLNNQGTLRSTHVFSMLPDEFEAMKPIWMERELTAR